MQLTRNLMCSVALAADIMQIDFECLLGIDRVFALDGDYRWQSSVADLRKRKRIYILETTSQTESKHLNGSM